MYKFLLLLILPILLFSGNVVYSLQIATFSKLDKAQSFKNRHIKELKKMFLYKTDSGYWTVRYGQKNRKSEIQKLKENTKNSLLRKAVIVPTSLKKLSQKKRASKRKLQKKKKVRKKEVEIFQDYEQSSNNEIDTFTFNIKVGARIYIIQFGDFPFSRTANSIFNKKPTLSQLNTVILSSGNKVLFYSKLKNLDKSSAELESTILPILNKGRKDDNIRVKAFKLKY